MYSLVILFYVLSQSGKLTSPELKLCTHRPTHLNISAVFQRKHSKQDNYETNNNYRVHLSF